MTMVAITGYASLDYVVRLDAAPEPNATVIAARPGGDWPRLGGSPCYVAMALVRAGVAAKPVTWVADDEPGRHFVAALRTADVPTDGVARTLAGRTPACILAYAPDGACFCLYDPGASRTVGLADFQNRVLAAADWVCVTVGPAEATRDALATLTPGQRFAWVVKADADAVPTDLRARLAARADLIVHSHGERSFVAEALGAGPVRPGRVLVETHGARGATVAAGDRTTLIEAAAPLVAADPTGAGDTFVGGMLAALISGPGDVAAAVRAGQRAAHELLAARQQGRTA